jgi:hypothetical protein
LKPQTEPHLSWNDFCRLVLKIIAELSPCPEPNLFVIAAVRGLERFGDGSLGDLRKLLSQCVQELQARGLVEINGEQLVITPAGSAEDGEDILDLTTELDAEDEDILYLTTELEIHMLGEAPTNQKQLQTQAQVTDSPKRAPEPTREEIIAAMRRIISDD